MRIAALVEFDLGIEDVRYFAHPFELADAAVQRGFAVLIADFAHLGSVYEMREFFDTVIFLHATCDAATFARALGVGDYCYRYDEMAHLRHRIAYLRRKHYRTKGRLWRQGELIYDTEGKRLYKNGEEIAFPKALQALLEFLIAHSDRFVDKFEILDSVEEINTEGSLKVSISKLRTLGLEIETRQGLGYKLKEMK